MPISTKELLNVHVLLQSVQSLAAYDMPMTSLAEKHAQLEASVTQRLKWAAGANPSLSCVLRDFEDICSKKDTVLQVTVRMK